MRNKKCGQCHCDSCTCKKPRPAPFPPIEADYVIVGLGSAGAALARYLTEDMKTSVIALEAGRDQRKNPIVTSLANIAANTTNTPTSPNMPVSEDPSLNWVYTQNPRTGSGPGIILPFRAPFSATNGRMWGGTSGHYSAFAVRGSPFAYDDWGAIDPQWSYNNILPLMKFAERYSPNSTPFDATQRGASGPISIVQMKPLQSTTFYPTMSTVLATPAVPDYNAPPTGNIGLSAFQQYSLPDLATKTYAMDFLPESVLTTDADGNGHGVGARQLSVISSATAFEIMFDKSTPPRAIGVRYFLGADRLAVKEVFAKKKVIVAAGSIESTKLLQLSGIGPAALLTKFGIEVRVANDNVGKNAQTHYGAPVLLPQATASPTPTNEIGIIMWNGSNTVSGAGPHFTNPAIRSMELVSRTNTSLFIAPDISDVLGAGPGGTPVITVLGLLMGRTNRLSTTEITSRDPLTLPRTDTGFYADVAAPGQKSDLDRVVDFYLAMADVSLAYSGLMPVYPPAFMYPNTFPGGTQPDDAMLRRIIRENMWISFYWNDHMSGTCRMSQTAATGVVDGNLDVHGVTGLSIADNSVVPEITDGHAFWSAIVVGLKKAKIEGAVGLP